MVVVSAGMSNQHIMVFLSTMSRGLIINLHLKIVQEGDVIAYRLIELSSSWTPELSSYRVKLFLH